MSTTTRRAKSINNLMGKASDVTKSEKKSDNTKSGKRVKIKTKEAYDLVMKEIDVLMKRGETNLSEKELNRVRSLAEAAEMYEDTQHPLPLPESLPEMIRMRMYQMQLNQGLVATLLGVSDAKFSLIMNGKQKPDIYFLKAVHEKLSVDASQILLAI